MKTITVQLPENIAKAILDMLQDEPDIAVDFMDGRCASEDDDSAKMLDQAIGAFTEALK